MKALFLFAVLAPLIMKSQSTFSNRNTGLKIQWKEEIDIPGSGEIISDLIIANDHLYYSLRGEKSSGIFVQGVNESVPTPKVEQAFFQNLHFQNNDLYVMGGCHLSRRSPSASVEMETCLTLEENWKLSAVAGQISNTGAYGLHWANMLAGYDLEGKLKWRTQISELTENHFLQYSGEWLFVYARILKPDLGPKLIKYDTLGNEKWRIAVGDLNNILSDNKGNCYAFCMVPHKSNIVKKFDSEGTLLWSKEVSGQTVAKGFLYGDSLFVCGIESIEAAAGNQQNPVFSILSAMDGKILHQQQFDFYQGDEGHNESFTQVVFNGDAVYLGARTGAENKKCFLVKLSEEGNSTGLKPGKTANSAFNIFPNPGGSRFTITCQELRNTILKVTVRNNLGQVVQKKELPCVGQNTWELDLSKQASGTYTVEIISEKEKIVKKVVVE
jgi:hypothetical protein